MEIRGAVAIVTGASSGIGRATALALARAGASVVAVARREQQLAEVIETCARHAPDSFAHVADLSDRAACDGTVAAAAERLGRVDVIVNNAGISIRKPAIETTVEDIERVMRLNFFAAVYTTMAALPGMVERARGSIVNVTSVAGYLPNPKESAYGASKAALSNWSHGLAVDLHDTGVHVGVLSPGPIATEIWGHDEYPAAYDGKMFPPEVVADAAIEMIRREQVHRTVPRRFGIPAKMYPLMGAPMRWGLRRYDAKQPQEPRARS